MLVGPFQAQLDSDKDGTFSREEFVSGFQRWFTAWDAKKPGYLDSDSVRDGMNKDLNPFAGPSGRTPGCRCSEWASEFQPAGSRRKAKRALAACGDSTSNTFTPISNLKSTHSPMWQSATRATAPYMDARNSDKKSFKVDLNEFVKGQKFQGQSKLNLH
jgi:hypothetical protein